MIATLKVVAVQSLSHVQLCGLMDCSMPGFPVLHSLPDKYTFIFPYQWDFFFDNFHTSSLIFSFSFREDHITFLIRLCLYCWTPSFCLLENFSFLLQIQPAQWSTLGHKTFFSFHHWKYIMPLPSGLQIFVEKSAGSW